MVADPLDGRRNGHIVERGRDDAGILRHVCRQPAYECTVLLIDRLILTHDPGRLNRIEPGECSERVVQNGYRHLAGCPDLCDIRTGVTCEIGSVALTRLSRIGRTKVHDEHDGEHEGTTQDAAHPYWQGTERLHYPLDVILLCMRWYVAYSLSLRNLEEMRIERGDRGGSFERAPLGHHAAAGAWNDISSSQAPGG